MTNERTVLYTFNVLPCAVCKESTLAKQGATTVTCLVCLECTCEDQSKPCDSWSNPLGTPLCPVHGDQS